MRLASQGPDLSLSSKVHVTGSANDPFVLDDDEDTNPGSNATGLVASAVPQKRMKVDHGSPKTEETDGERESTALFSGSHLLPTPINSPETAASRNYNIQGSKYISSEIVSASGSNHVLSDVPAISLTGISKTLSTPSAVSALLHVIYAVINLLS